MFAVTGKSLTLNICLWQRDTISAEIGSLCSSDDIWYILVFKVLTFDNLHLISTILYHVFICLLQMKIKISLCFTSNSVVLVQFRCIFIFSLIIGDVVVKTHVIFKFWIFKFWWNCPNIGFITHAVRTVRAISSQPPCNCGPPLGGSSLQ